MTLPVAKEPGLPVDMGVFKRASLPSLFPTLAGWFMASMDLGLYSLTELLAAEHNDVFWIYSNMETHLEVLILEGCFA